MIRLFGQAGHKVIVADKDITDGYSLTRFSRYVYKFINLSTAKSKNDYVQDLVDIWKNENVDWFVPVSRSQLYLEDVEAKNKMEHCASLEVKYFSQFPIQLLS